MSGARKQQQSGFTLIEVMVALIILAGGILMITQAWSSNFMRMRKSALFYDAATLLERKMVETEAKYKTKQFTEIPEEEEGDFGTEFPLYRWTMKSRDLKFPDLSSILIGQADGADDNLLSMIKQVSEYLSKVIKEVKVTVYIKRGRKEMQFSAVQYFVDYTQDFGIGGAAGAGAAPGGINPNNITPSNPATGGH